MYFLAVLIGCQIKMSHSNVIYADDKTVAFPYMAPQKRNSLSRHICVMLLVFRSRASPDVQTGANSQLW